MDDVFLSHTNVITSLGTTTDENFDALQNGISGLKEYSFKSGEKYWSSKINHSLYKSFLDNDNSELLYSPLESIMISSLKEVIDNSGLTINDHVGLIISSTKGNIDFLEKENSSYNKVYLSSLATTIKKYFKFKNDPLVVSNACVSGAQAVSVAKRLIQAKQYKHIFIVSGEFSF